MSNRLLYGDVLATEIVTEVSTKIERMKQVGKTARFATILVGEDPASSRYIEMKQKEGKGIGIDMEHYDIPSHTSQQELEEIITHLSERTDMNALLIQYPLPVGLNYLRAISRLNPLKDVDGLHPANLGLLLHDPSPSSEYPGIIPCTPLGVLQLLEYGKIDLHKANVTVVGRGLTIGAPLSVLIGLKNNGANATVTTVHSGTKNLTEHLINADVIVAAAGTPNLVTAEMVKEGATLVSVGVTYDENGKAHGDFTQEAREKAGVLVPVTKGVGPMTRANLWSNVIKCYELQELSNK